MFSLLSIILFKISSLLDAILEVVLKTKQSCIIAYINLIIVIFLVICKGYCPENL